MARNTDTTRVAYPSVAQPTVAAPSGRRSRLRWVLVLLTISLLAVLVLLPLLLWVLGTQSGLRSSLSLVEWLAPDLLRVERVDGRILEDLHLEGLHIRTPKLELRLDGLNLRWQPLATLTTGTLRISELGVRGLDITRAPPEDAKKASGPVEFPELYLPLGLKLELEQVRVEKLSIGTLHKDSRFHIDRIALAANWSDSRVTLRELAVALPKPRLTASAQGEVELTGDYPVDLGLTWNLSREPALQLAGQATVGGDLKAMYLKNDLTGSVQARLQALVRGIPEHPRWEGELSILGVDLPAIRADLPALDLNGDLTTSSDLGEARIQGNLVGAAPDRADFGQLRAMLDVRWRDRVLEIADLKLTENKSGARLTADGKLDLSDPAGQIDLEATWKNLRWPLTGEEPVAAAGQGKLWVRGTLDQFSYRVSSEVRGRDFPAAKLRLTGEGSREATQIEDLRIDTLDGKIRAKGRVAWSPEPSWALTLVADGINPGTRWPRLPARIWFELTSKGNPDAFEYDLEAGMKSDALPAATIALRGRGNRAGTRIRDLRLYTLDGRLRATVDVTWDPALTWDAELRVADINPGKQWPEWGGVLAGRILSVGGLRDGNPELSSQVASLTGELRGYPVAAAARVQMQGSKLRIEELRVASGPSKLQASGTVGKRLDLALDIRFPDLKSLLPDAAGSIRANGTVTGVPEALGVRFDLAADGVAAAGQGIRNLRGTARLELTPDGPLQIDLTGQGLVAGGLVFDRLRIQGNGKMSSHRLSARIAGEPLGLDLELAGGLKRENAYAGRLEGLALRTQRFGSWRLQKATPIALDGARISAGPLCIREATGSGGCARFEQQAAGTWSAVLNLDHLAFELFREFIPKNLTLKGAARAKADFKVVDGVLTGDAGVRTTQGVLGISTGKGEAQLNFTSANLALDAAGKGLRAKLAVPLKGLGNLSAALAIPSWSLARPVRPQQPLQGEVQARIKDFGIVSRLVPDLTHVTGKLNADFKLGGTLVEPRLDGTARLAGGGFQVPLIGLKVKDLTIDARAGGLLDRIEYSGGLKAGKGRLKIDGHTLLGAAGPSTHISAKGGGLRVANTKEYFVRASPDLRLEIGPAETKLTGTVKIPKARIEPRHIPAGTVSTSPDVVIASEVGEKSSGHTTNIDLRLVLGKRVTVDAFGLGGTIKGELAVLQSPGKEILGDGQLEIVDGTYRISIGGPLGAAAGRPLTIKQGFLNYAKSPITNPYLDLTAQREGGDITAGLRVFGTIKHPTITFFSATDPGMSQSEITKYLLTGIPPRRRGEERQDPAISLGTYISPRVFAEYDHSLGDESDRIKLRYHLNDWIELQAETGDAQGGDIFFTIER